eukprot:scpid83093/ scgid4342/ 
MHCLLMHSCALHYADCEYPEYDFRVLDECDRLPEHPISSSIRLQCANTRDGVALNVSWAITDDSYLYVTGFKVSLFDSGGKHCSFVLPAATMDQRYRTWFLLYDYSEMKPCIKERWFPGVLASLRSIAVCTTRDCTTDHERMPY